jgi:hypothetical protein
MIRVFIGYDSRETVAYGVLAHSINRHASAPVAVAPVMLSQLEQVFKRERNALQSTEFSFSRFLVPYLCGYEGWAVFMDCDMLMMDDVANLWKLRDDRYAVQVVKHENVPKEETKFLGAVQTKYQKKNWSSVMLMNCARCDALTPEYVNRASGLELHQFKWLGDDALIGTLPHEWNHLVDYDPPKKGVSLAHFTIGGPWFDEYRGCEYSAEWEAEKALMLAASRREKIAAAS